MPEMGVKSVEDLEKLTDWFMNMFITEIKESGVEFVNSSTKSKQYFLNEIRGIMDALEDTSIEVSKGTFIQMCLKISTLSFLIAAKRENWHIWETEYKKQHTGSKNE